MGCCKSISSHSPTKPQSKILINDNLLLSDKLKSDIECKVDVIDKSKVDVDQSPGVNADNGSSPVHFGKEAWKLIDAQHSDSDEFYNTDNNHTKPTATGANDTGGNDNADAYGVNDKGDNVVNDDEEKDKGKEIWKLIDAEHSDSEEFYNAHNNPTKQTLTGGGDKGDKDDNVGEDDDKVNNGKDALIATTTPTLAPEEIEGNSKDVKPVEKVLIAKQRFKKLVAELRYFNNYDDYDLEAKLIALKFIDQFRDDYRLPKPNKQYGFISLTKLATIICNHWYHQITWKKHFYYDDKNKEMQLGVFGHRGYWNTVVELIVKRYKRDVLIAEHLRFKWIIDRKGILGNVTEEQYITNHTAIYNNPVVKLYDQQFTRSGQKNKKGEIFNFIYGDDNWLDKKETTLWKEIIETKKMIALFHDASS